MAFSNTPRPAYVYDTATNEWIPVGVGGHSHPDYITQATAVNPTIIDAKGDIITATAADTPARLAVGNNGETLVADSSTSTGLRWQGSQAAGKNYLINGALDNWARGTSFAQSPSSSGYTADRWFSLTESGVAATYSQQTSSLPEGFRYSIRCQRNAGNTGTNTLGISQPLETSTSIPLQGKTIVLSYWAKAGANYSNGSNVLNIRLNSGTGTDQSAITQFGGWTGYTEAVANQVITTTWTRYQATWTFPSNATQLGLRFFMVGTGTAGANDWFEVTGVQIEVGSVATSFTRAGGTIQGELAACQRYYFRRSGTTNNMVANSAVAYSSTFSMAYIQPPVVMRTAPSSMDISNVSYVQYDEATTSLSSYLLNGSRSTESQIYIYASGTGMTAGRFGTWAINNTTGYLGFSAEL